MIHPVPDRLHALDAVRGFALLLGVALHATLSYLPGAKAFWIVSDQPSESLALLFYWIHLFRMTLFFVVAGFFGRMLLERLGLRAFLRDRARRIVAVLACAWPLVFPAIVMVLVGAAVVNNGGAMPETPPPPPMDASNFPLTHLWFLYVLAIFYVGALLLRAMASLDRGGRLMGAMDSLARRVCGPAAALLLALPAALALAGTSKWLWWFGVPTPDTGLVPNATALVAYGFAFACGWLLQRQPALLSRIADAGHGNLLLALSSTGACLAMVGLAPTLTPAPDGAATLGYAGLYALAGWAWTLALLGLALRHLSGYSPVRRYLSDASYWIYLVHLPLVMALQVLASRLALPWWLEYPAALALSMLLMLASYQAFVRHGRIGAWLNGNRAPRIAERTPQVAHVAG